MNLSFLKKLFEKNEPLPVDNTEPHPVNNKFDGAPFLSPWYFTKDLPMLVKNGEKSHWKYIDKVSSEYVGILLLQDRSNNILGLVKTYTYVYPSEDGTMFLIWNRSTKQDKHDHCITIQLYKTSDLTILDNTDRTVLDFFGSDQLFHFATEPISTLKYVVEPSIIMNSFSFPKEFKIFSPFLVVTEYEGLHGSSEDLGSTLLLEFDTRQDVINCYPQDWFNKSHIDRGYQWITRAFKDNSGNIHGQGIRISDFILDKTGTRTITGGKSA